jgi:hypothetical protein
MKKYLFVLLTLSHFTILSQVDTNKICNEINSLTSLEKHRSFWKEIKAADNKYRGINTIDSIDILNLVKSSMYFNKFGYPNKEIVGPESYIISYVWIHSKYPKASQYTFPIIVEGYRTGQIITSSFREYYSRKIYSRIKNDEGNKCLPIEPLINMLNENNTSKINIQHLLQLIEEEKMFLVQKHKLIGIWYEGVKYDTLYYNNKPVVAKHGGERLRIFQDSLQNYYYNYLYEDGSHYPQMLYKAKDHANRFYLFPDHNFYLEITDDGNLYKAHDNRKVLLIKQK